MGKIFSAGLVVTGQGATALNKGGEIQTGYKEDISYAEGGETLAQVAQRGGRCPSPGNTQGQVGWSLEQPDPGEDVPAHCRGLGWMASEGPFQPKAFYESMIL